MISQHRNLKLQLEAINKEITALAKEISSTEKENTELRAMLESKRVKEGNAKKNTEKIKAAMHTLETMKRGAIKREEFFNRQVPDHYCGFTCDF